MQRDLGWSRALISGAFSLAFVSSGLLGIPIGRLVDRRGARALMTGGSLLAAASLALLSQVREPWQFYLLWAGGLGLAQALTFYPVTFTVINNWFRQRRGRALALLTLLGGFASVVFYPLAGALTAHYGWRLALLVMAACQLLVCVPIHLLVLRRHPDEMHPSVEREGLRLRPALATGAFWALTASSGLGLLAHSVLLAHQVPYLIGRGFDPVFAAGAAGLLGLASLPSRVVMNLLGDWLGPRTLLAISGALQAAGVVLLIVAATPALIWLYIAVYGFAFGAVSPLRAAVTGEYFGRLAFGAITAAQGLPAQVLGAVGPLAAGYLYDRQGSYTVALWLCAGAFGVSAVAVVLAKPGQARGGGSRRLLPAPRGGPSA